jgi:DNA polymerase III beta subunit
MKINRYELMRAIDKAKGIVQKNTSIPALSALLIDGQRAIASNTEITLEVKLEASGDTSLLLPMRAFDIIRNLSESDLDIEQDADQTVVIRSGKITSRFASYKVVDFTLRRERPDADGIVLPGEKLLEAFSKVVFAADENASRRELTGVNLRASGGIFTITATDGHMVAIDEVIADGVTDMDLIIPKNTVRKLIGMDMDDNITLTYDRNSAVFETDAYTIYSRLIDGKYINTAQLFAPEDQLQTIRMDRKDLVSALTRANLCNSDDVKHALVVQLNGQTMDMTLVASTSGYHEILEVDTEFSGDMKIGMNPKMLLEALKGYSGDIITLKLMGPRTPVYISEEESALKMIVLPVNIT